LLYELSFHRGIESEVTLKSFDSFFCFIFLLQLVFPRAELSECVYIWYVVLHLRFVVISSSSSIRLNVAKKTVQWFFSTVL
jgi:hypothetical protein